MVDEQIVRRFGLPGGYDGSDYRGSDDTIHSQTCAESHEEIVGYRLEGHRLDSRQRESSINQLLPGETEILRCP